MIKRAAASITIGFVVTIAVTGLYAVSENVYYGGARYALDVRHSRIVLPSPQTNRIDYAQNIGFGFPLNWIRTTAYFGPPYRALPIPKAEIDWMSFGLDLSLYAVGSYPLTFLSSGVAPRFKADSERRLPILKNRMVICGSGLCLAWLIFYLFSGDSSSLIVPLASNNRSLLGSLSGLELPVLIFFSLVGVAGGILSTWKLTTGGVVLLISSAFLILFPGLLASLFFLNPEFAMLYVLWVSTMLAGGVSSLLEGILHTGIRPGIEGVGQPAVSRQTV